MKKDYIDYIDDILISIDMIEKFVDGIDFDKFSRDDKTNYAVARALEIIGEAVKKIPRDIRKEYKDMPWKEIAGMRDKLIHEYFGVNKNVIWSTIKEDLPKIKPMFEKISKNLRLKL